MNRATGVLGLGLTAFGITLAVYCGAHLSSEAMMVLTGAACGAVAMLPAVLISAMLIARARDRPIEPSRGQRDQLPYPPVIVVAPPAANPTLTSPYAAMSSTVPPVAPRQFTLIGDEAQGSAPDGAPGPFEF